MQTHNNLRGIPMLRRWRHQKKKQQQEKLITIKVKNPQKHQQHKKILKKI